MAKPVFDESKPFEPEVKKPVFDETKAFKAPGRVQSTSAAQAALEHFGNEATFGYLPQLQAKTEQLTDWVSRLSSSSPASIDAKLKAQGFQVPEQDYVSARDQNIARMAQQEIDSPIASGVGSGAGIVGNILLTGAAGKAAKLLGVGGKVAQTADKTNKVVQAVKNIGKAGTIGATISAIRNPGDTEGETGLQVMDRLDNAASGFVWGSALQGGLETLRPVSKWVKNLRNEIKDLRQVKPEAKTIKEAASRLGAPTTPGQISSSRFVQSSESALLNGAPTGPAMRARDTLEKGFKIASDSLKSTVGESAALNTADVGNSVKEGLKSKLSLESKPINEIYNNLKNHYQAIPVRDRSLTQIARNILKLDDVKLSPSSPSAIIAKRSASEIANLKTVEQIKAYKSLLNQSLSPTASPQEKRIVSIISEKLAKAEESTIVDFAKTQMKTPEAKQRITNLLSQRESVDRQYAQFKEKLSELAAKLGNAKKAAGAKTFEEFIDDLSPEKLTSKLFDRKDSEFLKFFSKNFPEEFQKIISVQKTNIANIASKTGEFSPKVALNEIQKLPPQVMNLMFSKDELQRIADVNTYVRSLPKDFNPSGTSHMEALRDFFKSPLSAARANIRDKSIEQFILNKPGKQTSGIIEKGLGGLSGIGNAVTAVADRPLQTQTLLSNVIPRKKSEAKK